MPQRSLQSTISLDVGDRVNHDKYGLGTVIASDGAGVRATVTIDFGSPAVEFDEFEPKAERVLDSVEWRGS